MQLQVNEKQKHEITGYATVGGFVGGIEAEASSLPEGFEESFAPGKYLYENGQIVENPDYIPPASASEPEERATLEERVSDLEEALAMAIYGGEAV